MQKKFLFIIQFIFLITFLSACVNKQSYTTLATRDSSAYHFRGKSYRILSSSKNYNETGIASWYGKSFSRKRTSSGERYNMYKMTAAHKTLPMSTYVEVTNLRNGKKVTVRVNDRGPFTSNRIIDLSYAAAKKIGIVHLGTAMVNVKTVSRA